MKGSILFNKDINIEVDVDPSAEEGARLTSAKNLVDGQELGSGGGGDFSTAEVSINNTTNDTVGSLMPNTITEEDNEYCAGDFYIDAENTDTLTAVLYKGKCQLVNQSEGTFTISGDITEIVENVVYEITGDCTIIIS